ncbi:serine/threonine-protein phosphatase 6 [Plasmodium falciparum HB3]|uniref:Serine/threonine-protein phosphatase n=1 Tax=Plasmodium falciparum (isolate HB3) TaxID=137071 RepID=A0A0L7KAB9_PLAFX|nr:serine/threonine-protein phosphatase 6 [Plasmodium falciparum HB3]
MAKGEERKWIEQLRMNPPKLLDESDLRLVCQRVKEILVEENNVQSIKPPVIICGDIHGQFFDLLELFDVGGDIMNNDYIFLGDYVDRGYNSVETFEYLLLLKLLFPKNITLLRGNHESRQITTVYGFYDECFKKYGNANAWKYCTDIFDYLTLAALVDNQIFCVHGGLSPEIKLIDQLRLINRVQEIPHEGAFGDIMWSDPDEVDDWVANPRGAGCTSSSASMEGYRYMFEDSTIITVWSAPHYCYRCGNVAAIMRIDEYMNRQMLIFKDTPDSRNSIKNKAPIPYFF